MTIDELINQVRHAPDAVQFDQVMAVIAEHYDYTPVGFRNGATLNQAGQNEGSCKLFAFALMNGLTPEETLTCFGDYYRVDVLGHPDGSDHGNIRNFMAHGWQGIRFDGDALKPKAP